MPNRLTLSIPMGFTLTFTTDAVTTGSYLRLANPGGSAYTPESMSASTAYSIGPFNEVRDYAIFYEGNQPSYSMSQSGVNTAADDVIVAAKRPLIDPITTYSANGAIAIAAGVDKITKAGVAALTLAAPTASDEGIVKYIVSTTANAHTVTATGLIDDGVTGGSKDLATFAAFAGASLTLMAVGLKWVVIASNNVAIS